MASPVSSHVHDHIYQAVLAYGVSQELHGRPTAGDPAGRSHFQWFPCRFLALLSLVVEDVCPAQPRGCGSHFDVPSLCQLCQLGSLAKSMFSMIDVSSRAKGLPGCVGVCSQSLQGDGKGHFV